MTEDKKSTDPDRAAKPTPGTSDGTKPDNRDARLKAALRANLRRRKAVGRTEGGSDSR